MKRKGNFTTTARRSVATRRETAARRVTATRPAVDARWLIAMLCAAITLEAGAAQASGVGSLAGRPNHQDSGAAQDNSQAASVQDATDSQDDAEARFNRFKGRLPNYFSAVVDAIQRQMIYEIQAKYNEQIAALEEQIEALDDRKKDEVKAVLTDEQRAEVERLQEEARARRSGGDNG